MKRNIWIDTDPGIDDAVAITAAFAADDRLNICGISAVAGNQTIDIVTHNALWLTELLGREDVSVVRGADRPLIREAYHAGDIHGAYGLGYVNPGGVSRQLSSEQGAAYIYQRIMELPQEEKVTMVTIGPLTNIGLLVRAFPDAAQKIDQIVCMGGSTVEGNITATAEYNIWADPEAAEMVFQSGIPIVMCGLDVTMKCILRKDDIDTLEKGDDIQKLLSKMLTFYFESPAYKGMEAVAMHDSVPVLYLLCPDIFSGEAHAMRVSCTEDMCRGMTVIYDGAYTYANRGLPKNVFVVRDVDGSAFRRELMKLLMNVRRP